ncbi:MAG TPA: sulfate/molybdate ABC transporter ATP-binding protein [Candidatus Binataceae bacterium]|nr:sulfate/molybdate ABC transporter ATP-binding protein [Candidatus Binataceae bacterium]
MSIQLRGIYKKFDDFTALDGVTLDIKEGELLALLGPSGSGKTTLLRIIAGLEFPDSGSVRLRGEEATGQAPQERGVGLVFQHYALFRHMTVFENVAFGLRVRPRQRRPSEHQIQTRVRELLELVQLEWTSNRYPSQLSGGQRQRIALARALAVEPHVLLLDEPFGALDAKLRAELRQWLRKLHQHLRLTGVFVTHDQEEALEVASRVAVMNKGKIEQIGTPEQVYHQPSTPFVSGFLGTVNLFHGRVHDDQVYLNDHNVRIPLTEGSHASRDSQSALVYVRPHMLELEDAPSGNRSFAAIVRHINAAGPRARIELTSVSGEPVLVELEHERVRSLGIQPGGTVYVRPRDHQLFVY